MNKRIIELMLEAEKTIPGDKHIDADFCAKFAESIVRECMDVVADCKGTNKFEHWTAIKEHFKLEY